MLTLTSVVSTKGHQVDSSKPSVKQTASKAELEYFLRPSKYVPTDGIVGETAVKATAGATTGRGQGARAVRVGGGEYVSRSEGARLREGRHSVHAGIRRHGRKVRRHQCTLCGAGAVGGDSGAPRLRPADCGSRKRANKSLGLAADLVPPRASIAERKFTCTITDGFRWTRPMCARSHWRSLRATWH